jgi:tetratricopeptide (TPR) repeat protein
LNLWSPTCTPCLQELAEWTNAANALRSSGVDVVTVSVDTLLEPSEMSTANAQRALDKLGFRGSAGMALPQLVETLEMMHDTFVYDRAKLPLPSSFLLDGQGRLAAIYKGPVPVSVLLADVATLDDGLDQRRASAVPFTGRWASVPLPSDAAPIVRRLDEQGLTDAAVAFARKCIEDLENTRRTESGSERASHMELSVLLGKLLLKTGQRQDAAVTFARTLESGPHAAALRRKIGEAYLAHDLPNEAVEHLRVALQAEPDNGRLLYHLGIAELALRQPDEAIVHLKRAHELMPGDSDTCFHLANALHGTQQTKDALVLYRQALRLRPGWPFAANNLAWILTTHPDASIRNGTEAVALAEALCKSQEHPDPSWLATLAAAYAEVGRFDDATTTNERAADLAESRGQSSLAKRLRDRSSTFAKQQPLRD